MHDLYIKDAQYGIPTKTSILASLGFSQPIVDGMCFMENDALNLVDKFVPLQSSYTSSGGNSKDNGRPTSDDLATKESLLKMVFSMVKSSGNVYIFQNANYSKVYESIQNFELDRSKITFTNKLYF